MPDLSHLWQRFVLACALVFGLALGIGATVFGYSNTAPVNLSWSVLHARGVPLWAVVLVPLGLVLVAGTVFHWLNSLHHFSEHMNHRHRVQELEKELASLRAHLDSLLEMPDHSTAKAALDVASTDMEPIEALAKSTNGAAKAATGPIPLIGDELEDPEAEEPTPVA